MKIKHTVAAFFGLLHLSTTPGCREHCEESFAVGEAVRIPVQFSGFDVSEMDNIRVYRIHRSGIIPIDSFFLKDILWARTARSTDEIITDETPPNTKEVYGYYRSYLDSCDLILNWYTGSDTLSNFEIKKSKIEVTGCHANDPNVRIDKLSFVHKGKVIGKDEGIQINK